MTKFTEAKWNDILTRASNIGTEHGESAATWIEFTDADAARKFVDMLDEGDPEAYDSIPSAPSGQYADDYSPRNLFAELEISEDDETDDGEIWSTYADAFETTAAESVEKRARSIVFDADLDALKELTVWQLSRMAGTSADPDAPNSAGGKFLTAVRDTYVEHVEYKGEDFDPSEDIGDVAHEIADGAPDVYTHTRWMEFVDIAAYHEDISDLMPETGDDLTKAAGVALYMIAERLVYALHAELTGEDN
jgi:hypothetical protein